VMTQHAAFGAFRFKIDMSNTGLMEHLYLLKWHWWFMCNTILSPTMEQTHTHTHTHIYIYIYKHVPKFLFLLTFMRWETTLLLRTTIFMYKCRSIKLLTVDAPLTQTHTHTHTHRSSLTSSLYFASCAQLSRLGHRSTRTEPLSR